MIPARLTLRNFLCYRGECPPLDLEYVRVACLTGDNGNGKSALLDAMTWALWGKARGKSDGDLVTLGQTEMEVEFEFFAGEARYRVIRKYRRTGSRGQGNSSVLFQALVGEPPRDLSGSTVSETNTRIREVVKLTYETFINSAFLMQGRADEFTVKNAGDRKEVLAAILNLAIYDTFEERAKDRRNERRQRVLHLDQQLGDAARELEKLATVRKERDEAQTELADAGQEHTAAKQWLDTLMQREAELNALRGQQAKAENTIRQVKSDLSAAEGQAAVRRAEIARHEQVLTRADVVRDGHARLLDARERLQRLEVEHDSLTRGLADARGQRARTRADLDSAEAKVAEQQRVISRFTAMVEQGDAIRAGYARLVAARATLNEQSRRFEQHASINERLVTLRHIVESAARDLRRDLDTRLGEAERLRVRAATLADLTSRRDATQREQAELDVLDGRLKTLREEAAEAQAAAQALKSRNEVLKAERDQLRQKFETLKASVARGEADCPLCRSNLGHDGLRQIEDTYRNDGNRMLATIQANKQTLEQHEATAQVRAVEANRLEEELAGKRADWRVRQDRIQREMADAREAANELPAVESEVERLNALLDSSGFAVAEQDQIRRLQQEANATGYNREVHERARQEEAELRDYERQHQTLLSAEAEMTTARSLLILAEETVSTARRRFDEADSLIAGLTTQLEGLPLDALRTEAAALASFDQEHQALRDAEITLPLLQDGLAAEEARVQALRGQQDAEEEHIRVLSERIGGLTAVEQELGPARSAEQGLAARCRELRDVVVSCERDIERLEEMERGTRTRRAQLAEAKREQGIYDELTRAFGKQGVQAMIIDSVLGEVEAAANDLLARMTNNRMHVTLETQKETQKGTVRETLDIKIADEWGTRAYEMFSGGEAFRINLALRIALSKLLARRAGAPLPTLVIDEGFGTQDTAARERLVEAINAIQDDFQCLLIVTHLDDLKDLFETRIEVVKSGDGSVARVVAA